MRPKRPLLVVAVLMLLGGCSLWSGRDDCDGDRCEPDLLDNTESNQRWYCYGTQEASWDCVRGEDPTRIAAIRPARQEPLRFVPEASQEPGQDSVPTALPAAEPEAVAPDADRGPAAPQVADLLAWSPDHFTVQLIALQDLSAVLEYARANGLSEPLYTEISSGGERWHVLLLGVYGSRDEAERAKTEWERTKTLKVQPWVRSLGPLQEAVRSARGS